MDPATTTIKPSIPDQECVIPNDIKGGVFATVVGLLLLMVYVCLPQDQKAQFVKGLV